jgi:hypothetical protein
MTTDRAAVDEPGPLDELPLHTSFEDVTPYDVRDAGNGHAIIQRRRSAGSGSGRRK